MIKIRNLYLVWCSIIMLSILAYSCTKDSMPENPYDSVDYSGNTNSPADPDPNSIAGLHRNIFFPKCANPGCHDGTFEPDFRTVESSYYTLVYHPVIKVTLDSNKIYSHRVIPNNTADSWLVERLTTLTTEYMPSNAVRLSSNEINRVKNWINAGCPDMNGNVAVKPNLQPNILAYVALDSAFNRIDTIRKDDFPLNPFLVNGGSTMTIAFVATDTADGDAATDPSQFTVKEIRFSTDKNNFSGATVIPATLYVAQFSAWFVTVPVSWPVGQTVYFRIYVNDGHHTQNAEFPRNESLDYYKTIFAFHVQ